MKAKIHVTLKNGILDPQGKTIHHGLEMLGFTGIREVRAGKLIEIFFEGTNREQAQQATENACKKLLANPVIEDYDFVIVEDEK
ncbi:MAG: phosphoribosylformylglycinamidine synthase subunit PurS [candidate division KSB1 bacterium]|nr:phosphoribosylformylglycinamidine synthase subunit PurS [candidate division KSB1 bacterium]MDZ7366510.1 phosphoribosylformylglycinamidine synthase subunit PurS [candidate division KSB1 bacterium]MDZ7404528.1 phosphoribosylformylglycinamidine synthase subunit PurS [candidate division KSB1 bacterium]